MSRAFCWSVPLDEAPPKRCLGPRMGRSPVGGDRLRVRSGASQAVEPRHRSGLTAENLDTLTAMLGPDMWIPKPPDSTVPSTLAYPRPAFTEHFAQAVPSPLSATSSQKAALEVVLPARSR